MAKKRKRRLVKNILRGIEHSNTYFIGKTTGLIVLFRKKDAEKVLRMIENEGYYTEHWTSTHPQLRCNDYCIKYYLRLPKW